MKESIDMSDSGRPWSHEIPALRQEHVANARLFADRHSMIMELGPPKAHTVVELGVAVGSFSDALIRRYDPIVFFAIDQFKLHTLESLWGSSPEILFGGKTHAEHYLVQMAEFSDKLRLLEGDSAVCLELIPDRSADVIYIDASHHYADVLRDANVAVRKIKEDGLLIFNDYILREYESYMWYGVVPVVNDLVVNQGWDVAGFAMAKNMYCDIALMKR